MRLALLSNVTVSLLADMLGGEHAVWQPDGFGLPVRECLEPPTSLRTFDPEAIFLLLDGHAAEESGLDVGVLERSVRSLAAHFPQALILAGDLDVPDVSCRPLVAPSPARALESAWNGCLARLVSECPNVCPFRLKELAENLGRAAFYDARTWYAASMPFSLAGLRAIAARLGSALDGYCGRRKKVLAVDLDNTLWKGVVGEDGPAGVRLAPDADGRPYTDFQKRLLELKNCGVLLVCLSRNNREDVAEMWNDPRMVLREADFAAVRIDWNAKSANLRAVAGELNLGVDSFVFVDDDPAERGEMKANCPEVTVPDFPKSASGLPLLARQLAERHFAFVRTTAEDASRTVLYRAESERRRQAPAGLSSDDYLRGLAIRVAVRGMGEAEIARVAQLSQKANQFNVSEHRYAEGDVRRFAESPDHWIFTVRVSDAFGDLGLVAFVHVVSRPDESAGEIVDWVMSCRAMNRTVEYAVQDAVEAELVRRGVRKLRAEYRATSRNAPVAELYERLGFSVTARTATGKSYEQSLPAPPRRHLTTVTDRGAGRSDL